MDALFYIATVCAVLWLGLWVADEREEDGGRQRRSGPARRPVWLRWTPFDITALGREAPPAGSGARSVTARATSGRAGAARSAALEPPPARARDGDRQPADRGWRTRAATRHGGWRQRADR